MKRIFYSLSMLVFVGALAAGATGAFFSDSETSTGNTFTAGEIDLKIDNESYYNGVVSTSTSWSLVDLTIEKFFNFPDLKPGDFGEDTISLHVETNDAYLCAELTLTSNEENGINEPEDEDGDTTSGAGEGELGDEVNFVWWADDGDNVLEVGEDPISQGPIGALDIGETATVTLADSGNNIWTDAPGPVLGNLTYYIGKAWCFGDLTLAPLAQDGLGTTSPRTPANSTGGIACDGSELNNITQTDSLTADVTFRAVQSRNNSEFLCVPEEPPTFGQCSAGQQYADSLGLFEQGRTKTGALIVANRSNPSAALGAPQTTGTPSDAGFPAGSFVSLGFNVGTTTSRSLVLNFDNNVIVDGPGADVRVYEVTGGTYPDELISVEVSQNGVNWFMASSSAVRDASVDISGTGLSWARYVRVTDLNNPALFSDSVADGYDVDAIEALNCGVPIL